MTINVVSFSGGRTSAFMVHLMEERRCAGEEVHYIFMDTGAEHPKTYEFVYNIALWWGIPITCLRANINPVMNKASSYTEVTLNEIGPDLQPWKDMLNKYGHPYVGGAFCTDRMKTVPFTKYCEEKFGKGNYTTWLGIRTDEPKRLKPRDKFKYLADISDFDKQDVLDWWKEQPFDLGIQEHLGNCVFCIKKSLQKVALATKDEPALADEFVNMLWWNDVKEDKVMYRSNNSLEQVIALFGDTERDELASRMKSMRQYDTGSCSESCEAFNNEGESDLKLSEKALKLIDEEIVKNGIPEIIETPYEYSLTDDRVIYVGGGAYVCELKGKFFMGTFTEDEYAPDCWDWKEITKDIFNLLQIKTEEI